MTTGFNTAIENLAIFVEKHCAKSTENMLTKINDSYHWKDISETLNAKAIPDNAILLSFDIVNMFPSIGNNRVVVAVKSVLNSWTNLSPSTECIIEAFETCLTNNNSTFIGQNLIKTNGTAMGAANSCSYSNLAIQPIDNTVIGACRTIFQKISYLGRYRDDCITIWAGNIDKIDLLLEFLNFWDENFKLTLEICGKSLYFLDLKINVDDEKLLTSVYSKPTNSHLYLDGTSCHPTKSIDTISTGVAKRLKWICPNNKDFLEQSKKNSVYLAVRNHKPKQIIRAFEKINNQPRSTFQQKRAKKQNKTSDIYHTIQPTRS